LPDRQSQGCKRIGSLVECIPVRAAVAEYTAPHSAQCRYCCHIEEQSRSNSTLLTTTKAGQTQDSRFLGVRKTDYISGFPMRCSSIRQQRASPENGMPEADIPKRQFLPFWVPEGGLVLLGRDGLEHLICSETAIDGRTGS